MPPAEGRETSPTVSTYNDPNTSYNYPIQKNTCGGLVEAGSETTVHILDDPGHLDVGTPPSSIGGFVKEIGGIWTFGTFHEPRGAYGNILGNAATTQSPKNARVLGSPPSPGIDVLLISSRPGDDSGGSDQSTGENIAELGDYDLNFFNLNTESGLIPVDVWYKDLDLLTLYLPKISREKHQQISKEIIDDNGFEWIHTDASMRLGLSGSTSLDIVHWRKLNLKI
ncbi:hypothetical protein N7490_011338 [Penicillium lividum]|nr:hypothetical protein N7490_011338 [Penicillium lividum]